ncbi:MAG: ABC-2 transporter permease [Peptoniphilus sp.]|nr:ABC-2 transporter permease [Peptoniphilus sp.]
MKAIFLNDLYNLKGHVKNMLFMLVIMNIYPLTRIVRGDLNFSGLLMLMLILSFLVNSYILNTCYYDDSAGFPKYIKAIPIDVKDYVKAKFYLLVVANLIVIILCLSLVHLLYQSVELTVFVCSVLSVIFAVNLINLTFTMKMGYDKFSIYVSSVFIIAYFIIFFLSQKFGDEVFNEVISSINILYLLIIMVIDGVLAFTLKNAAVKFFQERIK